VLQAFQANASGSAGPVRAADACRAGRFLRRREAQHRGLARVPKDTRASWS